MSYRYDLAVHSGVDFNSASYYSDVTTDSEAMLESVAWARAQVGTGGDFEGWAIGRLEVTHTLISITELP